MSGLAYADLFPLVCVLFPFASALFPFTHFYPLFQHFLAHMERAVRGYVGKQQNDLSYQIKLVVKEYLSSARLLNRTFWH